MTQNREIVSFRSLARTHARKKDLPKWGVFSGKIARAVRRDLVALGCSGLPWVALGCPLPAVARFILP